MKIIGRILLILAVFTLVMGVTYVIVNARSSSASSELGAGNERFSHSNGALLAVPQGTRPAFPGRDRNEFHGERGGGGWLFGPLKNMTIIGVIVMLIALPKSWMQKRKRTAQVAVG